ncbi:alpha/beta hydrolase [Nonomuraea sp. NPDC050202]|jgi:pimeloyl-ACP methyl ester carboxylesterase|uniref:alpha/beta fold hydrolase n=1 Tax=Nonomuraea sp. NPDC050202 TaxID=3155035 RepID=UPI0033D2898B
MTRFSVPACVLVLASATAVAPASAERRAPCPASGTTKPTVVLVHGAWADTSSWSGEIRALQQSGHLVRAVGNPLRGLTGDAGTVRDFLRTLSGPVVLVGHSYGGSVITNAAAGDPDVKALVYVNAAAPAVGETTAQLSGSGSALGGDPATLYDRAAYPGAAGDAADLYLKRDVFVRSFASDLPRDTAHQLWATQRAASTAAFTTPSKAAAWQAIPSWYFIATGDKIIVPASQRAMAERARSKVTEFAGGSHLTLVSHPEAVTRVIEDAICSVR